MNSNSEYINGLSKNNVMHIIKRVEAHMGHRLSEPHIRNVLDKVNSIDRRWMETHPLSNVLKLITQDLIHLFTRSNPKKILDMHEIQKETIGINSEEMNVYSGSHVDYHGDPIIRAEEKVPHTLATSVINIDNILGVNSSYNIRNLFNPSANMAFGYIHVDTRYRVIEDSKELIKQFKFNIHEQANMINGGISIVGKVRDIVAMEISPFFIPKPGDLSVVNEIDQYHKITLRFHEYDSQGVIAQENRYYHYEFEVIDLMNTFYRLVPLPNTSAKFYFRKPITLLSSLTLSFGTPLQPLLFDKDRLVYNGAVPSYVAPDFTFTTTEDPHLSNGDLVYMTDFTTGDAAADVLLIQSLNRSRGNVIHSVNNSLFQFKIDVTGFTAPVPTGPFTVGEVYFGSKRISFKLQFTYISGKDSNED